MLPINNSLHKQHRMVTRSRQPKERLTIKNEKITSFTGINILQFWRSIIIKSYINSII